MFVEHLLNALCALSHTHLKTVLMRDWHSAFRAYECMVRTTQSIWLPTDSSIHFSIRPSTHLPIHPATHPAVHISMHPGISPSMYSPFLPSIHSSTYLSATHSSLHPFTLLWFDQSICPSIPSNNLLITYSVPDTVKYWEYSRIQCLHGPDILVGRSRHTNPLIKQRIAIIIKSNCENKRWCGRWVCALDWE